MHEFTQLLQQITGGFSSTKSLTSSDFTVECGTPGVQNYTLHLSNEISGEARNPLINACTFSPWVSHQSRAAQMNDSHRNWGQIAKIKKITILLHGSMGSMK